MYSVELKFKDSDSTFCFGIDALTEEEALHEALKQIIEHYDIVRVDYHLEGNTLKLECTKAEDQ